jgi:hypothetical protein
LEEWREDGDPEFMAVSSVPSTLGISARDNGNARTSFSGEKNNRRRVIPGGGLTEIAELLGGAEERENEERNDAGLTGWGYI